MTSANQLRAARALLGLTQESVATLIESSTKTVRRAEAGEQTVSNTTVMAIRVALEKKGIVFIDENGGGAGVRLKGKC